MGVATAVWSTALLLSLTYLYFLNKHINTSRFRRRTPLPCEEELFREGKTWPEVDVLKDSGVDKQTHKRYLVTGAAGQVGTELVKLLSRRAERLIFAADLAPHLPEHLRDVDGIQYLQLDISSPQSVHAAFDQAKPDVVFHLAAAVRYWERMPQCGEFMKRVNIGGTQHIIDCLGALADASEKMLVYCSTISAVLPPPNLLRLGWRWSGYRTSFRHSATISDETTTYPNEGMSNWYAITKTAADKMVREANGRNGLNTGVLRPGLAVCSPTDLFMAPIVRRQGKDNAIFIVNIAQSIINAQDLAMAHLYYEKALRERPQEVAGHGFLVTSETQAWTFDEMHSTTQLFAGDLHFFYVPFLILYLASHFVEAFLVVRHYSMLPFCRVIYGTNPSAQPKWMEAERVHLLQPSTWDIRASDCEIDDSRARKLLGYRHRWSTAQTLCWIADVNVAAAKKFKVLDAAPSIGAVPVPPSFGDVIGP